MKTLHIGILGSYGEGNNGDEAILSSMIATVHKVARELKVEADITVFSHNPEESQQLHDNINVARMLPAGFRSFFKQFLNGEIWSTLSVLMKMNAAIIGGGGIFYDAEFSSGRNPITVWLTRVSLLRFFRIPIMLYAVGVESVTKAESKRALKKISQKSSVITVRDAGSKKLLLECGVTKEVEVTADPVWSLQVTIKSRSESPKFTIGLAFRDWFYEDQTKQKNFHDQLHSIITWLETEEHATLLPIPFSTGKDDDRKLYQKLNALEHEVSATCLEAIQSCDLVIGMRLHSIIMAALAGVPFISLAYSKKVQEVVKALQLEEYSIPLEQLTLEKFQKTYHQLRGTQNIREQIHSRAEEMKMKERQNQELLSRFLSRPSTSSG